MQSKKEGDTAAQAQTYSVDKVRDIIFKLMEQFVAGAGAGNPFAVKGLMRTSANHADVIKIFSNLAAGKDALDQTKLSALTSELYWHTLRYSISQLDMPSVREEVAREATYIALTETLVTDEDAADSAATNPLNELINTLCLSDAIEKKNIGEIYFRLLHFGKQVCLAETSTLMGEMNVAIVLAPTILNFMSPKIETCPNAMLRQTERVKRLVTDALSTKYYEQSFHEKFSAILGEQYKRLRRASSRASASLTMSLLHQSSEQKKSARIAKHYRDAVERGRQGRPGEGAPGESALREVEEKAEEGQRRVAEVRAVVDRVVERDQVIAARLEEIGQSPSPAASPALPRRDDSTDDEVSLLQRP